MAEIIDVIKGIQQAVANSFDGSGAEGTGLRRDEPTPITDRRIMDGFGCRVQGDILLVSYHAEMPLNNSKPHQLQDEVDQTLQEVISFLKKEYKKIIGENLELKKLPGNVIGNVQSASRVRSLVRANCKYEIQSKK